MSKLGQTEFIQCRGKQEAYIHLSKSPFSLDYFVNHKQRDEGERDGGYEPTQDVGPEWINIGATELQRGVFDDGEDEGALVLEETKVDKC